MSRIAPLLLLACLVLSSGARATDVQPTTPPAPKPEPAIAAGANVNTRYVGTQVYQQRAALGFAGMNLSPDDWTGRDRQIRTLQLMMRLISAKQTDPKSQGVARLTLEGLMQKFRDDPNYNPEPREYAVIPDMLTYQLLLDKFMHGRQKRSELNPNELRNYDELYRRYTEVMGAATLTARGGPRSGATVNDSGMPPMHHDHEAMEAGTGVGAAVADTSRRVAAEVVPPAGGAKPLMDVFHAIYATAVTTWQSSHAPTPVPPVVPSPGQLPTPAPGGVVPTVPGSGVTPNGPAPNSGNDNWSGLPPSDHVDQMIKDDPSNADAWRYRASGKFAQGDFSGALADAQKAVQLGGGVEARLIAGQSRYGLGDMPGANADAKEILKQDPSNRGAVALLHFTEGRAAPNPRLPSAVAGGEAGAGSNSLEGRTPADLNAGTGSSVHATAEGFKRDAVNALKLNDLASARDLMTRALELDPTNPAYLNLRAMIYSRLGEYGKAAADAKAGLETAPRNAILLRTKGYAEIRGKNYKDALASAGVLLELNRDDAYALALKAHAEGGLGDREAMLADLKRAAALDPRFKKSLDEALQAPADADVMFLFPGEPKPAAGAATAKGSAPAARASRFGLVAAGSAAAGLLLALGLLGVAAPSLRQRVTSVFTRVGGATAGAGGGVETARPASVNAFAPGSIRGQYEISRQIGAGGMGMVFEGTDRSLGRRVAIKKMRDEIRHDARERARFVAEARTVAALHHPNIVDIYAIAEDGDDVFLVFEFVDGKTVHDLVQTRGTLEPKQAADIVRASAEALEFAHGRGVIHRDMKPSNVMLDAAGRIKVMDFGIARAAKDAMTRYSMTNTVVGTPPYMAPEQEQGQVRRESDVYALAICAYEMLTGRLPFAGIGGGMLLNKINMSFVKATAARPGLKPAVDAVFERALQADPDKRYRTPREFSEALTAALA